MVTRLDITSIQSMNLFNRITGIKAKFFFNYASSLIFIVDPFQLNQAMGERENNLRKLGITFKKRVKIVPEPTPEKINRFVKILVSPVKFKSLSIENGEVIIKAGPQGKASLIGRNHANLDQLQDILRHYFKIRTVRIA
jgi:transcription antitermination factor NusA-like protein